MTVRMVAVMIEPYLPASTIRHRIKNTLKKISVDLTEIATALKIESADQITHYWARIPMLQL